MNESDFFGILTGLIIKNLNTHQTNPERDRIKDRERDRKKRRERERKRSEKKPDKPDIKRASEG